MSFVRRGLKKQTLVIISAARRPKACGFSYADNLPCMPFYGIITESELHFSFRLFVSAAAFSGGGFFMPESFLIFRVLRGVKRYCEGLPGIPPRYRQTTVSNAPILHENREDDILYA